MYDSTEVGTSARKGASVEERGRGLAGGALRAGADAVQVGEPLAGRLHDETGPVAVHVLPAGCPHLLRTTDMMSAARSLSTCSEICRPDSTCHECLRVECPEFTRQVGTSGHREVEHRPVPCDQKTESEACGPLYLPQGLRRPGRKGFSGAEQGNARHECHDEPQSCALHRSSLLPAKGSCML